MILYLDKYIKDPLIIFVMCVFICGILEYFTSYIMEKIFKTRWWDYSNKKFNINGRICLDNLVLFGVLGLLIFYVANPFFEGLVDKFNYTVLIVVSIVLFIIFMIDGIISLKVISGFKNVAKSIHKDSTDEIFRKEGMAASVWRDKVYRAMYNSLNDYISGKIELPTISEFTDTLPPLPEELM